VAAFRSEARGRVWRHDVPPLLAVAGGQRQCGGELCPCGCTERETWGVNKRLSWSQRLE